MALVGLHIKNFAIVDFFKENKVAAVPSSLIINSDGGPKCYWPSGPGADKILRDCNAVPLSHWTSYPIKILKYYSKSITIRKSS